MPAPRSAGARQLDVLIKFVQKNKDDVMAVGNGRTPASPMAKKEVWRKWEGITLKLNAIGPTKKSAKLWRQYWTELKYGARRKFAMMQKDPNKTLRLTDLDEQVLGILGEYSVDGKMFEDIVRQKTPSPVNVNIHPQHSRLAPKPNLQGNQQPWSPSQEPGSSPRAPAYPHPDPLASTTLVPPKMEPVQYAEFNNHARNSRGDSISPFNPPDWAIQLEMKQQELLQLLVDQSTRTNTLLENVVGSLAIVSENLRNVVEGVTQIKDAVVKSSAESEHS